MEEYIRELMNIASQEFGTNFEKQFERIALTQAENNPFSQFLSHYRLNKLLSLIVFDQFDRRFIVGTSKYFLERGYDEHYESLACGCAIAQRRMKSSEVFSYILGSLSLSQLDYADESLTRQNMIGKNGFIEWSEWEGDFWKDKVFLSQDIIITDEEIYATKEIADDIKRLIASRLTELEEFLKEYGPGVAVSHEHYIDWLLKWFPGKIRMKLLSQDN